MEYRYRQYQILKGDVGLKIRELIRQTCEAFEIEIIKRGMSRDPVHLFVCFSTTEFGTERNNEKNKRGKRFQNI
jgi:REP element-mobilizing transposase RayT